MLFYFFILITILGYHYPSDRIKSVLEEVAVLFDWDRPSLQSPIKTVRQNNTPLTKKNNKKNIVSLGQNKFHCKSIRLFVNFYLLNKIN